MQNLTKKRKQPPVVFLQQVIFYNIYLRYVCGLESVEDLIKVFCSWIFRHIFFNDINHGYRADILKKNYL